jgi:hypothetical protein
VATGIYPEKLYKAQPAVDRSFFLFSVFLMEDYVGMFYNSGAGKAFSGCMPAADITNDRYAEK